jgi:aromatic ring-opening dioxygenase LigB subunit
MPDTTFSRAIFMCHAPIVIPSIGDKRADQCRATTEAMFGAAGALAETKPDRVILLNPHLTRYPNSYACLDVTSGISGSFKAFGMPGLKVEFPFEQPFFNYLAKSARENQFALESLESMEANDLDHGAMVPLWFLGEAGYKGPVCIIGFPWKNPQKAHTEFGRFLKQACGGYDGRTAIIASGDMSHRLQYGAPSGYHPRAHEFDKAFREHIEAGELAKASQIPVDLRDLAAEDSSESMAITAGAIGETVSSPKVLSYEAPFGVGYLVAVLA